MSKDLKKFIASYRDKPSALTWAKMREVDADACKKAERVSTKEGITRQNALYDAIYKAVKCPVCGNRPAFQSLSFGYKGITCSSKCAGQLPEVKSKRAATNVAKYGKEFTIQVKKCAKKRAATMLERHGVEWAGSSEACLEKGRQTKIKMYGSVDPLAAPGARDKRDATMMKRHGVLHIMQVRDIHEAQQRKGYTTREVVVEGKTYNLRGYEPLAVTWLHEHHGISGKHILSTAAEGVPSVPYTKNRVNHVYHPDLKVKFKGKWWLVEVKSSFTGGLRNDRRGLYSTLVKKAEFCEAAGFRLMVAFVDERYGVLPVTNIQRFTRRQMIAKFNAWRKAAQQSRLRQS